MFENFEKMTIKKAAINNKEKKLNIDGTDRFSRKSTWSKTRNFRRENFSTKSIFDKSDWYRISTPLKHLGTGEHKNVINVPECPTWGITGKVIFREKK